jgi:polysaccharide deacetylase family protein (PEP-CTERM system associated)
MPGLESEVVVSSSGVIASTKDVFTIDVEDWFHILEVPGTPALGAWETLPTRIESNFRALLELLSSHDVHATCFVLGWVAKRFPKLLREAAGLGHDVASHGFAHQTVSNLTPAQFRRDIRDAKAAIEDAIGASVHGYRAPGFSITRKTFWAFEEIVQAGYTFDSSVFPSSHGHGGIPGAPRVPHIIPTACGPLREFPITIADTPVGARCFFGGGYLRMFPLKLILAAARQVRREGRNVIWYIHPREIDPDQPRLRMNLSRHFKSYVNLRGTTRKLNAILCSGGFATLREMAIQTPQAELRVFLISRDS